VSKLPSEATQIRTLKRQLAQAQSESASHAISSVQYRQRATKAEQEAKEWKDRFDLLLRQKPATPAPMEQSS